MDWAQFVVIVVAIVAHTGALFYWGGGISKSVKIHDGEIATMRTRYHDTVAPAIVEIRGELRSLQDTVQEIRKVQRNGESSARRTDRF